MHISSVDKSREPSNIKDISTWEESILASLETILGEIFQRDEEANLSIGNSETQQHIPCIRLRNREFAQLIVNRIRLAIGENFAVSLEINNYAQQQEQPSQRIRIHPKVESPNWWDSKQAA